MGQGLEIVVDLCLRCAHRMGRDWSCLARLLVKDDVIWTCRRQPGVLCSVLKYYLGTCYLGASYPREDAQRANGLCQRQKVAEWADAGPIPHFVSGLDAFARQPGVEARCGCASVVSRLWHWISHIALDRQARDLALRLAAWLLGYTRLDISPLEPSRVQT